MRGLVWVDARGQPYPALAKVKTYNYELGFHYPLHHDWRLDLTVAARNDKTVFPATDRYSLNFENLHGWWNINSLTLRADKFQPTIPMAYKGWQGSIMLDGFVSGVRDKHQVPYLIGLAKITIAHIRIHQVNNNDLLALKGKYMLKLQ